MYLEIKNIHKFFGTGENRTEVLKGINCNIEKGSICVLLGPSGSGKSTLLNIIGGIETAEEGSISINGDTIENMNEKQLSLYRRKHLGYVFQSYNLIPNLTVRENIEVGAYLSDNPLNVDDLMKTLGLYEHRNKIPNQLSGGQQQRTSIGRAIVKNPDLLLCDEPTGALDYKTSKEILKLIADVNKKNTSYTDTTAAGDTKYVYTVRAYKKAGGIKYMAAIKQSKSVKTPKAAVVSQSAFTATQKDVMKKILYAVETGGQVYGNQNYGAFTKAYTNSSIEHAITIGAGQWYATEAQRLLKLIHTTMGDAEWKTYDKDGKLWNDVQKSNWSTYKKTTYKKRIVNIIKSDIGKKCQDQLMYQQITEMEKAIRTLGITDIKAVGMFINIEHQGGYSAVPRVLAKTKKPYNLSNVYKALASDSGNQVGTYKTRQAKVYQWLNTYMK